MTYCFQHELGQKIYFQVFRCQNTYFHPQQNLKKKKSDGWGIRRNRGGGGWLGMFLIKGGKTGFSM